MTPVTLEIPDIFYGDDSIGLPDFIAHHYIEHDIESSKYHQIMTEITKLMGWELWVDYVWFGDRIYFKSLEQVAWFLLRYS